MFGKQGSGGVILKKTDKTLIPGFLRNMRKSGYPENSPERE
jgi:hypothetical protein